MRLLLRTVVLAVTFSFCLVRGLQAGAGEIFRDLQQGLNDWFLDLEVAPAQPEPAELRENFDLLQKAVQTTEARTLLAERQSRSAGSAQPGELRAILQHVAAIEMLQALLDGKIDRAKQWRALITLPRFAEGVEGVSLLEEAASDAAKKPEVARILAHEYLDWQSLRVRQLGDFLEQAVNRGTADEALIQGYCAEIRFLTRFPPYLTNLAKVAVKPREQDPVFVFAHNKETDIKQLAIWRSAVEENLPDLLTAEEATHLERLLVRFVALVPIEYASGVKNGRVVIPLELRQAQQFLEQSQLVVNELAPAWKRAADYGPLRQTVSDHLATLRGQLDRNEPPETIQRTADTLKSLFESKFRLSARSSGDKDAVVRETAVEVHRILADSLAAVKADRYVDAESQRLEAYTSFDADIEPRVLPRNPDLAIRTERAFLDGTPKFPGIKASLDRRAPISEIEPAYENALRLVDESVNLLTISVSPVTIGFTAFSIVAREGMEAVVILAALLAGLRGAENRRSRRGIAAGAWVAIAATGLTFWVSQTVVHALSRFGEQLEAVVSVLAVIILLIVTNWVFHKFYWVGWNAKLRGLSKAARVSRSARWESLALIGVGFLTIYREGFELSIFLQSLLLEGSPSAVMAGGCLALLAIGLSGWAVFRLGIKLPFRRLMVITGVLVVSIMVSFLGQTVRLFQTVGWLSIHPIPNLELPGWAGLWFGIYPSWEGFLIPPLALFYVAFAWIFTKWRSALAASRLGRSSAGLHHSAAV